MSIKWSGAGLGFLSLCLGIAACNIDSSTVGSNPSDEAPVYRNGDLIPGQYIVVFNQNAIAQKGEALQSLTPDVRMNLVHEASERLAVKINVPRENITATFGTVIQGVVIKLNNNQVDQLRKDPAVRYIEQDRWVSLPPFTVTVRPELEGHSSGKNRTGSGGSSGGSTQEIPWGVQKVGGSGTPSSSVTAWIVDTGIDLDHPDLNVATSRCKNYVTTGTNTTSADDINGHGTHVAGIIGAINNSYGVVGIAQGINLVAMRVLDEKGSGQWSWSISAFDYIAANGNSGDVVNYSVGPTTRYTSSTLDDAVKGMADQGIKVCLAAGNQGDDASYYSPARTNATNVYTIAAMNSLSQWQSWSNYGSPVDWIEPGTNILSTYKGGTYATMSGTSMATPHATGMLAVGGITSGGSVSGVPSGTESYWGRKD